MENEFEQKMVGGKLQKNPWILVSIILGVAVILLLITNPNIFGRITGNVVGANTAADNLLAFYESAGAQGLEIESVESQSGLYKVNFLFQGQIVPIYMTKDGKFAGSLSPISASTTTQTQEQTQTIPKSDNSKVELFVMTHCPYGTQAEKGFIPAIKALGSAVDAEIRFVHYFLHEPEETETPKQVCIREEQSDKFIPYLECFLEDGDSDRCLTKVGIDKAKMQSCISSGKADEYYAADSAASEAAGVRGSPTLVINGAEAQSGRSAADYVDTICSAFNTAPGICDTLELSSTTPSAGFGYSASSTGSGTAQC